MITIIVKAIGFTRELLIAFYFGVSQTIDNYVLFILAITFFIVPVSGSFSTLLTPRYIQFDDNNQLCCASSLFKKTLIVTNAVCYNYGVLATSTAHIIATSLDIGTDKII